MEAVNKVLENTLWRKTNLYNPKLQLQRKLKRFSEKT